MRELEEPTLGSKDWNARLDRMVARIAREGKHDLDILQRAGANRQQLLKLLAITALSDDEPVRNYMRSKKDELRSVARRLGTLARDASRLAGDPMSRLDSWIHISGGLVLGTDFPNPWEEDDPLLPWLLSLMRTWAEQWDLEAKKLGRYLRKYAQTERSIVLLLIAVNEWTKSTNHFERLAGLLTDAFEAAGKRKCFSGPGLRETFKRHAASMVRLVEAAKKRQTKQSKAIDRVRGLGSMLKK